MKNRLLSRYNKLTPSDVIELKNVKLRHSQQISQSLFTEHLNYTKSWGPVSISMCVIWIKFPKPKRLQGSSWDASEVLQNALFFKRPRDLSNDNYSNASSSTFQFRWAGLDPRSSSSSILNTGQSAVAPRRASDHQRTCVRSSKAYYGFHYMVNYWLKGPWLESLVKITG